MSQSGASQRSAPSASDNQFTTAQSQNHPASNCESQQSNMRGAQAGLALAPPFHQLAQRPDASQALKIASAVPTTTTATATGMLSMAQQPSFDSVVIGAASAGPKSESETRGENGGGPLRKVISKRRVRNRFGPDPSYMGFTKRFVINSVTNRANQVLQCLRCDIRTNKMCNMMEHIKTHNK